MKIDPLSMWAHPRVPTHVLIGPASVVGPIQPLMVIFFTCYRVLYGYLNMRLKMDVESLK